MSQTISKDKFEAQIELLKARFSQHMDRHPDLQWEPIEARLRERSRAVAVLVRMEETGGEPDVIGYDAKSDEYLFCDGSEQTPTGRRNTCYDETARLKRKKAPPERSAVGMAEEMGVTILTEEEYRKLQELGEFDTKTSSWVQTPERIRDLGGAIFCDRRYTTVFTYHNGADSYYSGRGFRGMLRV